MIGAGAIALGIGFFGYSLGSPLALFYAILLVPLNWCVLVLEEAEQQRALSFTKTNLRFVLVPLAGVIVLELAIV